MMITCDFDPILLEILRHVELERGQDPLLRSGLPAS